jgi:hypothetical protein
MAQPVPQRIAKIRVRFHLAVRELPFNPLLQLLHHRPAFLLMACKTLLMTHSFGLTFVPIDLADRIHDHRAFGRTVFLQFKGLCCKNSLATQDIGVSSGTGLD